MGKFPPLPPVCSEDTVTGVMTPVTALPNTYGGRGGHGTFVEKIPSFRFPKVKKGHPMVMTTPNLFLGF